MSPETAGSAGERWDDRTVRLIGKNAARKLAQSRVLVVGVGGVGGYAAEMLARSGVGHLTLVDSDNVSVSNINRQLIATSESVGLPKTQLFEARFREINPELIVKPVNKYVTAENIPEFFNGEGYDFVVDAIDTVAPKTALILHCLREKIPVISSMGAGGRIDPTKIGYFDIADTREDGLARAIRRNLRSAGIHKGLKVVASTEKPSSAALIDLELPNKRISYGTIATIPAIFGIFMANHVIRNLINTEK